MSDKARIAVYDDFLSAPRVVDIPPQNVQDFIEAIASAAYELSRQQGGALPYTVIREITENFIHAGFLECTVSILNDGNTIRFADQGPGITKKDLVLQPGVSSATSAMKEYIRGVGSGFPIVREYLSTSRGFMTIDDNAEDGVIVTISLAPVPGKTPEHLLLEQLSTAPQPQAFPQQEGTPHFSHSPHTFNQPPATSPLKTQTSGLAQLSEREERALFFLNEQGILGPVDLGELLGISAPTASRLLKKLELLGMVESTQLKKRILSNVGMAYVQERLVSGKTY